jgi:hypothetical protein
LKPARYGNGRAMPDVAANNDLARAGLKPAPTGKCPHFRGKRPQFLSASIYLLKKIKKILDKFSFLDYLPFQLI